MKGSIALGWLLATVLFALLGNTFLTVAFFVGAVIFSIITLSNDYRSIKQYADGKWIDSMLETLEKIEKGETNEC